MNSCIRGWEYEGWSAALDRHFLHEPADHPIVLCVDAETLANLTGQDGEESARALARCVGSEVMPEYRFGVIAMRCGSWASGDRQDAPPSLPLLAVTVLAASRMDRSTELGTHNYYRRLRELLDPSDDRHGMPGNYGAVVPKLWRQLEIWLNEDLGGSRGILTLPSEEELAHTRYRKEHRLRTATCTFPSVGPTPSRCILQSGWP